MKTVLLTKPWRSIWRKKWPLSVPMSNPWKGTVILYISHFYLDLGWCCLKIFSRRRNEMDQTLKNDIHIISLLIGKNYMTKNNDLQYSWWRNLIKFWKCPTDRTFSHFLTIKWARLNFGTSERKLYPWWPLLCHILGPMHFLCCWKTSFHILVVILTDKAIFHGFAHKI